MRLSSTVNSGKTFQQRDSFPRVVQGALDSVPRAGVGHQEICEQGETIVNEVRRRSCFLVFESGQGGFVDSMSGGKFGLSIFAAGPTNQLALSSGWNHSDFGAVI